MKIRLAQFGLGPIGLETLKLVATKPWAQIVGAVDVDPAKCGRDLGQLTGIESLRGQRVCRALGELAGAKPEAVLHTAVSKFKDAYGQILPMAQAGINVVSSCEELLFPQLREPKLAAELDAVCKQSGARVVAAGVNPGFVMDLLPLCITAVSCSVRSVRIDRVVNASTRRGPLQKKIGSGLEPAEFRRLLNDGKAGHAGLRESVALLAHGLGWTIQELVETGDAVVADHDITTAHVQVKKGQTCGTRQRAEATVEGKVALTLDIKMYLDAPDPHDTIRVEGNPPLEVVIRGGVAGDQATVAALVNTVPRLIETRPGLLLVTDLPAPRAA